MKNRLGSLLVVVCALAASPLLAQTTGDIDGVVSDGGGQPLPGVTVEAKSAALQGVRTVVTDAAGRYRFPALPPGGYTVSASLSGFRKVEKAGVRVVLGASASVPIQLALSQSEEVVVTGEVPVIDVAKTTIGTSAPAETIAKLPLGRNFASIAQTVAGTGSDFTGGLTVYGATSLENAYIVDGVNTTGVKTGAQAKSLNNEFVQEVEVKTGGYEAEYGRVLGGTINVITKSGGNEFHGDAFGYYDSSSLGSSDAHEADRTAVSRPIYFAPTRYDLGADLGGYFLKDQLWFFGAVDRVAQDQDFRRSIDSHTNATSDGQEQTRSSLFAGKLTARLGTGHSITASAFGDPGTFEGRLQVFRGVKPTNVGADSANLGSGKSGGTDLSVKYDGILSTKVLAQAQFASHTDKADESSPFANQYFLERFQPGFTNDALPGSGPDILYTQKYTRYAYKASSSLFLGANELKGGLDWEHLSSSFSEAYGGGDRIRLRLSVAGALRNVQHRYFAKTPIASNCIAINDPSQPYSPANCSGYNIAPSVDNEPTTDNVAFFLQDSFKVLPNLTINGGLRYETQSLKDYAGNTVIKIDQEWSPRVGIVWDFLGNGKSKAYANFGRFYEVIPQDIQTRALGNEYTMIVRNNTADRADPVDAGIFGYAVAQGGELTQDGLKGMYQDEVIGGVEYEFARNWAFGIKGIYKSLGRTVEDRCDLVVNPDLNSYLVPGDPATCALINPGSDDRLATIKDSFDTTCYPNGSTDANGAIVPSQPCEGTQARRYYRALELTLNHRFSNGFYALASYLYSNLQGNYSGNLSQTRENGQADPNINADFDYPGLVANAFGRLPNDRKHQVKVSGFYSTSFGLTAGLSTFFMSGKPFSVRGCALDPVACGAGYNQEGYLLPRGSGGELPAVFEADLHLEYALKLGSLSITPVLDVFNLLNRQGTITRDELFNNDGTNASNAPCANGKYDLSCATNPNFGRDVDWQTPRVIRLGARVSF